jgi:hypothetical protein
LNITPEVVERARSDFKFFCRTFLKIKPKKEATAKGVVVKTPLVSFIWNEAQEIVWSIMREQIEDGLPIKLVICKARQFGISTFFMAWVFWNMWRRQHTTAGLAAGIKSTTIALVECMNTFYESFPPEMRPQLRNARSGARTNKEDIYWTDRKCSLSTAVAKSDAFRGQNLDIAICTEVSSYADPFGFFEGFLPTMNESRVQTLVLESSPKDGYFWSKYNDAKDGLGGFKAIFLPWWIVPSLYSTHVEKRKGGLFNAQGRKVTFSQEERAEQKSLSAMARKMGRPAITDSQMYWRQLKIEEYDGDEEVFNQEYPRDDVSCFMRSTQSAFKSVLPIIHETVEATEEECDDELALGTLHSDNYADASQEPLVTFKPEFKEGYIDQERRAGLLMFRRPVPGHVYVIGADVADELVNVDDLDDESAFSVACVYDCNTKEQVAEWRGKLDPFDFGDELAKLGYFYNSAMLNVEINNMGQSTVNRLTMNLNYPNSFRWPKFDEAGKLTKKEHWYTDTKTKRILIEDFKHAVREYNFVVRSPGLEHEMIAYVSKGGVYQRTDTTSDRIIAAALAWQCVAQTEFGYSHIVMGAVANTKAYAKVESSKAARTQVVRALTKQFNEDAEYDSFYIEDLFESSSIL